MIRRPAFTLLELLISSTLFVVIAVAIVGILAATSTVQETGRQSQMVTSQLQEALSSIETTISRVAPGSTVYTFQPGSQGANTFLILQTSLVAQNGSLGDLRYEVICVNSVGNQGNSRGVLMQYVLPLGAAPSPSFPSSVNSSDCNGTTSISTWFTNSSPITTNYLTDADPAQLGSTNINVTGLWIQSVIYANTTAGNAGKPQGYDIELSGSFKGTAEARASDIASLPITMRGTAVVAANPKLHNLSQ